MLNGSETILVVDDETAIRRLVTLTLQKFGYKVYGSRCGERGYDCFMEYPEEIALVLSDIMMPIVSGPEMVARILKERHSVKVLFMTGGYSAVLPAHYKRFPILEKPFTSQSLLSSVRKCLDCS